jgi:hypothetical protein
LPVVVTAGSLIAVLLDHPEGVQRVGHQGVIPDDADDFHHRLFTEQGLTTQVHRLIEPVGAQQLRAEFKQQSQALAVKQRHQAGPDGLDRSQR